LRISEQIASTNKQGKFLCRLLFKTLDSLSSKQLTKTQEQVVTLICQGWLDILTLGHLAANSKSSKADERLNDSSIYALLEADDIK
jgi:hypothetical protein